MLYFIDGYNLLFRMFHSQDKLEKQRNIIISFLIKRITSLKGEVYLIFDGKYKNDEFEGRDYFDALNVIYTPKGQTADNYIIDRAEYSQQTSQITVISSDKALTGKCKALGCITQSIDAFLNQLLKKQKKPLPAFEIQDPFSDTRHNIERLQKIFEKKLKEQPDDWN